MTQGMQFNPTNDDVNFLSHLKFFEIIEEKWKQNGIALSPMQARIYLKLAWMWNDCGKPNGMDVFKDTIMSLAKCGSSATYALAMKRLHELRLIFYDDRSNQHKNCQVWMSRLDTAYEQYKTTGDIHLQQYNPLIPATTEPKPTVSHAPNPLPQKPMEETPAIETEIVKEEKDETADNANEALDDMSLIRYASELMEEIQGQRVVMGMNRFHENAAEVKASKELVKIIAQGTKHNFTHKMIQTVQIWADKSASSAFHKERFYPTYINTKLLNSFMSLPEVDVKSEKQKMVYQEGIAITTTEGKPFPALNSLNHTLIKAFFKEDIGRNNKHCDENRKLFRTYLNHHKWFHNGEGWIHKPSI